MLKAETDTSTVYYTRGFELISRREGATASYYIYDGGLSVRALTNESGTVTDTVTFDAFGNETGHTGTTDNSYGFQGEEQDATGLYYLRARYMDPATGTFTTMDTYGGSLSDPMSLHKYLFANSNPVRYSDPSGHMAKLAEQVVVVGIMATLGAEMDGILYIFNLEHNNIYMNSDDFWSGLYDSMIVGAAAGVLFGLLTVILIAVAGAAIAAIILGVFGIGMSTLEILTGILEYNNGNRKTGITEIIFGIIGAILSGISVFKGIKCISANTNVGLKATESASDYARSEQGHGRYPGVDEFTDSITRKGSIICRGEPNGTGFFTTTEAVDASGCSASKVFQGLQVYENPAYGYRQEMGVYLCTKDLATANGITLANPAFGEGGLPQIYVPNANSLPAGTLVRIGTIPLH